MTLTLNSLATFAYGCIRSSGSNERSRPRPRERETESKIKLNAKPDCMQMRQTLWMCWFFRIYEAHSKRLHAFTHFAWVVASRYHSSFLFSFRVSSGFVISLLFSSSHFFFLSKREKWKKKYNAKCCVRCVDAFGLPIFIIARAFHCVC